MPSEQEMHNTAKAAESPLETRLSALLKESKIIRNRLRAKRTDAAKANNTSGGDLDRKSLRNVYLKLLFNFPFSSRTGGVEADIWTETCYPGVQKFRSSLDSTEKQMKALQGKISAFTTNAVSSNEVGSISTLRNQESQMVQVYLRGAKGFRNYLQEEETFWRELVGRVVKVFNVEEARPYLQVLGIPCDWLASANLGDDLTSNTGLGRVTGADVDGGNLEVQGRLPANRQRLISIIHKALMCCGDLSRYRELYKMDHSEEAMTLKVPSRGSRGGPKRRGRGSHNNASSRDHAQLFKDRKESTRDYSQAGLFYEQARALLPTNGQPSNQIAVLALYNGRNFTSVYYYYRAMCVSVPFNMTKSNLGALLQKAIKEWEAKGRIQSFFHPWDDSEQRRLHLFNDLVVLHAHYFLTSQGPAPSSFAQHCHQMLASLLADKSLAADTIVQIVVAAISSLWTRRLWRGTAVKAEGASTSYVNAEQQILFHLMGVMTVLAEVSCTETQDALDLTKRSFSGDPDESDPSATIAKNITAAFRRMLPALRIASKWLKSHVDYVQRSRVPLANAESVEQESSQSNEASNKQREELNNAVSAFWSQYVSFLNVIRFAFPFDQLPKLGTLGQSGMTSLDFEEDRDMRGFVPLKKAMLIDAKVDNKAGQEGDGQLHPNEEYLIRIADILIDAKVIAESDSSPIAFDDERNHFHVLSEGKKSQTDSSLAKSSNVVVPDMNQSQDTTWEAGSESAEDAVDLAMRAVDERRRALGNGSGDIGHSFVGDGEDDNDDDGEIILIPSSSRKEQFARSEVSTASPSGSAIAAASVSKKAAASNDEPLTAQHLLLQMINGGNRSSTKAYPPSPSTPQPQLLFGGITSANSQGPFGNVAHHGGAWDGNEAVQFMNQQQQQQHQQQQGSQPLPHPIFTSSSPWDPPSQNRQGAADWR